MAARVEISTKQRNFFDIVDQQEDIAQTPIEKQGDHPVFAKRVREIAQERDLSYEKAREVVVAEDRDTDSSLEWWQK